VSEARPARWRACGSWSVEDEADTRALLSTILRGDGAVARTARTAREALSVLPQWKPDILVSDVGLPDGDGYALRRQVRALPPERGGAVPAVALTAHASLGDRDAALRAGFQVHVRGRWSRPTCCWRSPAWPAARPPDPAPREAR
jgi:CheY-like chemotaxis protein